MTQLLYVEMKKADNEGYFNERANRPERIL